MTTALRKIAKSHEMLDGTVTVWFLPIVTVRHNIVLTEVCKMFGVEVAEAVKLYSIQYSFMLFEGHLVDIEFKDMDENDERYIDYYAIKQYWDNRVENDIANNWLWFSNTMTTEAIRMMDEAWVATRRKHIPKLANADKLKEKPPEPDTPENEKKTGNGRKRSKRKSAVT